MKTFEYSAADETGHKVSGVQVAADEAKLVVELERKGLVLTRSRVLGDGERRTSKHLGRDELVGLTNQLATVTSAGIPIIDGLRGIGARLTRPAGRDLVEEMVARLTAGESLSTVMEPFPKTFSPVYRASVAASETSGALDLVLDRMAKHLEWARAIRGTTIQTLIYPAILMVAVFGLILILLLHVLPRLMTLFPADQLTLPWQTQIVMGISDSLRDHLPLWGGAAAALVVLVLMGRKSVGVKQAIDRVLLRVPKLGTVLGQLALARFASTASTLQSSGCDVFSVLQIASRTCGNSVYRAAFDRVTERVRAGEAISSALEKEACMDPLLVQMVAVGEKAGALDAALAKLAEYYDEEVPRMVKKFLALLEPALLLGAGAIVAFILMAAILPLFQIYENMG